MKHSVLCLVCNDISHFQTKLLQTKKIVVNIRNINAKYHSCISKSNTNNTLKNILLSDKQYCHFKCGKCMRADLNALRTIEKDIVDQLMIFLNIVETNKDKVSISDFKYILSNLAGNYSLMYKTVDKFWHQH